MVQRAAQTSRFFESCVYCDAPAVHDLKVETGTLFKSVFWLSLCERHFQALKQVVWDEVVKEFER